MYPAQAALGFEADFATIKLLYSCSILPKGGASTGETTLGAAAAGSRQFAVFAPENNGITAAICCYIATHFAETRRLRWMRERSLFYTTFTARSARGPARGISWVGYTDLYNQKESSRR
jgi:hypothetical protein